MKRATTAWALRDGKPEKLATCAIDLEKYLEDWIVAEPGLLEPGLRILARQLRTASGPLDLLALDAKRGLS
jgi:RecB family endonuclease NucS